MIGAGGGTNTGGCAEKIEVVAAPVLPEAAEVVAQGFVLAAFEFEDGHG